MFGCTGKKSTNADDKANVNSTFTATDTNACIVPKYAKGFQVTYTEKGYCLLDIRDPQKEKGGESYHFVLKPKGLKITDAPQGYTVIETPVKSTICMTSLQLSNFIKLGELNAVVGITSTRHLFNTDMQKRLDEGKTHKIGIEGNFDNEIIMGINPDIILISPFKRGGYDTLTEVGIPLIPHLGYKEMTPLGQAEWIKFVGLLIGKEEKANRIFADIEKRYLELTKLTSQVKKRPVVFSGELRGGNWYAVGGKSFLAQLFKDAGADYFLKDDTRSGGVSLDFETVYSQAAYADYWRIVNSYKGSFSYQTLQTEDIRYADFQAFKKKQVIYCNMSQKPFYESMPVEPEVVLADLIAVFHPQLLPDHTPRYYELLKQ
ncbi:MAG: ABC transporter substrate-binding protein [Phocaeicola plebeius]|nr:ABC transporter substrate-binding protein [Phocaeicola plebeius]MCI6049624.1 ABC transporter substrate-binding protein [Phocaeicola plebeius]MDD6912793.1 ABC transporter substrate-binding protein [Phocaeicola plebeius]